MRASRASAGSSSGSTRSPQIAASRVGSALSTFLLPVIVAEKCIGCGLCEFKCPAPPAIKVYTPDNVPKARQKA